MKNRVVLITGAAKRIGRAIALSLAKDGWDIAIHYNTSQTEAEETLTYINSLGVNACLVQADLTDHDQVKLLVDSVKQKLGFITCLINNASSFKNDTILNFSSVTWGENMAVNLVAPAILSQEFTKQLPSGQNGNIINMLDYAVLRFPEKFMSYTTSKAALWTLTQQLALSLAPQLIRVNGIGPGRILSGSHNNKENFDKKVSATPLGLDCSVEEVCATIKFILGTPSMTGQMLTLDGGRHLMGPEAY